VKNNTARDRAVVSENKGKGVNAVKALACWGNPHQKEYKEKAVIDSGYSRQMTRNKCYLDEYEDFYLLYGSAGGRVITAAGGRSYKENSRFGSSYDDKSWFGKGYIYRNYILPIFLAGLNLSTCFGVTLLAVYSDCFWMIMLVMGLVISFLLVALYVPAGP
ncbi:hypothetical protein Tco_0484805, partial [Tanacetum coccineum]